MNLGDVQLRAAGRRGPAALLPRKRSRETSAPAGFSVPSSAVRAALTRLGGTAIVILLVGLLAAFAAMPVARLLGYGVLVVRGGSMGKALPSGSLVFTKPQAAEEVRPGDVIVIRETTEGVQARPKLHRVVSLQVEGDRILVRTKGDANAAADPNLYVVPDRVAAASRSLPYLGFLVGAVTTPLGWVLGVALPASVLCFFILHRIWSRGGLGEPEARTVAGYAPGAR